MQKRFFFICLFAVSSLVAKKAPIQNFFDANGKNVVDPPWLTGPLLAPSGISIPPGHYNIEPYFYAIAETGNYDSDWKAIEKPTFWNTFFQPSFQFGLLSWLDFQFNPTLVYNHTDGASQWGVGDMPVGFDIQLYKSEGKLTNWITALKLALKETIPLGKYQNLKAGKLGTDSMGLGSWQTGAALVWGNLFYLGNQHFLTLRCAFEYNLPAPVDVKNLNAFGGGRGTRGTVYPAQSFTLDIGLEYTLTRNWVVALDIVGEFQGKTRFKGTTSAPNSAPKSLQFSLAPAIEYNWSGSLGIIFGPWFTVAGWNSGQFYGGVFAFNYYH